MESLGEGIIYFSLLVWIGVTAAVMFWTREKNSKDPNAEAPSEELQKLRRTYLVVYLLATFADWLQGPYVYALYASYGYSDHDNAILFVAGFGASMVFGTYVGALADKTGRRKSAQLYCILYIVSCLTKHVSSYPILMVGRITGGIATSLLFSVFESWYVSEHNANNLPGKMLGETFGMAIFANSIVAVLAGFVSQQAANLPLTPEVDPNMPRIHMFGYTGPFDLSSLTLVVNMVCIRFLWGENYGQQDAGTQDSSRWDSMKEALNLVWQDPAILSCGLVAAFFESSMFIFVFKWTPAVTGEGKSPPYGTIFAAFMVSAMLGSRIFALAMTFTTVERIGQGLLAVAAISHMVPLLAGNANLNYLAFLLFELTVGMYFPMIGTLKSNVVPETCRATIYNIYRVPMNFIVISALVAGLDLAAAFRVTTLMLIAATAAQTRLTMLRKDVENKPEAVAGHEKEGEAVGRPNLDDEL